MGHSHCLSTNLSCKNKILFISSVTSWTVKKKFPVLDKDFHGICIDYCVAIYKTKFFTCYSRIIQYHFIDFIDYFWRDAVFIIIVISSSLNLMPSIG